MTIIGTARRQRGFSLIEALISLTVLTSGLLALAQFQSDVQFSSSAAKTQTTAINLAQQKLEELHHQSVIDHTAISGGGDTPTTRAGDNTTFNRRWVVTPHDDSRYHEVQVFTEWTSREGDARSVGVTSILTPSIPYTASTDDDRRLTLEADTDTATDSEEPLPPDEEP